MQSTLKSQYREILIGFEEFSFSEQQISEYLSDFRAAEHDYKRCLHCRVGTSAAMHCSTFVGDARAKGYYALDRKGCSMYKRPSFAVHKCPGPVERREQIAQRKIYKKGEPLFEEGGDKGERQDGCHTAK